MAHIIRNYQAGERVVLSDWTRQHGTKEIHSSPEEQNRRAAEQAVREAEHLREQATQTLIQAQEQADALLAAAQEEAVTIQATAQAEGYEEGYSLGVAEGQQKGEAALSSVTAHLAEMLTSLQAQRQHVLRQAEEEVVQLTLAMVEKLVGQIAQHHEPLILHTVQRALAFLAESGPFALRVHPQDRTFLQEYWEEHISEAPGDAWELVADPAIARGGCLLMCGPTTIDARLSTQMKAIVNGLHVDDYVVGDDTEIHP